MINTVQFQVYVIGAIEAARKKVDGVRHWYIRAILVSHDIDLDCV